MYSLGTGSGTGEDINILLNEGGREMRRGEKEKKKERGGEGQRLKMNK